MRQWLSKIRPRTPKAGKELFNGEDLSGWLTGENNKFVVENGGTHREAARTRMAKSTTWITYGLPSAMAISYWNWISR